MSGKRHNYPAVRKRPAPGSVVGQAVNEARRRAFLDVLRQTGIFTWACRAASPHSERGCVNSFRDLMKRDPTFAAEVREAQEVADARLEREALRRGVEGVPEGVFQKGQRVYETDPETGERRPATIIRYSDNLLLRLLEKRDPDSWAQHRKLEHKGSAVPAGAVAAIALSDVNYLSDEQRRQLAGILRTIQSRRQDDSEVVVDADWTEVEEEGETSALLAPPTDEPMAMLSPEDRAELEEILT